MDNIFITIAKILFSHSDHEAQTWGGLKADISEAFRPTGNGGAWAEPPLGPLDPLDLQSTQKTFSNIYIYIYICTSNAQQSVVEQSLVVPSMYSSNSNSEGNFERIGSFFERSGSPKACPSGYVERTRSSKACPSSNFECFGGTGANPSGHFERSGSTGAGPSSHFERSGGTRASPSAHFERSGGTRAGSSGHFERSGGIGASPGSHFERSGSIGAGPIGHLERQVAPVQEIPLFSKLEKPKARQGPRSLRSLERFFKDRYMGFPWMSMGKPWMIQ